MKTKFRLGLAILLSIPIMLCSMFEQFRFPHWQSFLLWSTLIVAVYCGAPFHRGAWRAARHGGTTMDTLVSCGVLVATGASVWAVWFAPQAPVYFEAAAMITTFLLVGKELEGRARKRAEGALAELADLGGSTARCLIPPAGGEADTNFAEWTVQTVPVETVSVGAVLEILPGQKIPVDGTVLAGKSSVDEQFLTGEAIPKPVFPASPLVGGGTNLNGTLIMRAEAVGADTRLAQIAQLVAKAQAGKAPVQRLADRISAVFVPIVLLVAVATWLIGVWGFHLTPAAALTRAIAVLVAACPCSLGLATPTALLVGTSVSAQLGVLFRRPPVLEALPKIDLVAFDKTGTVTAGKMTVREVAVTNRSGLFAEGATSLPLNSEKTSSTGKMIDSELLRLAAAVEIGSQHPIAQAITAAAALKDREITVEHYQEYPGFGGIAQVGTQLVAVGNPKYFRAAGIDWPEDLHTTYQQFSQRGDTLVTVAVAGAVGTTGLAETSRALTEAVAGTTGAMVEAVDPISSPPQWSHELKITGMTCASCVGRVERALQKLPEVTGIVNLVTAQAQVTAPFADPATLVAAVEKAGYQAQPLSSTPVAASSPSTILAPTPSHPTQIEEFSQAEWQIVGMIGLTDPIRPEAAQTIAHLTDEGVATALISGDHLFAVTRVGEELGITDCQGHMQPEDKQAQLRAWQESGHWVAMVGDGTNDSVALVQAGQQGIGIALATGTEIALESADLVLTRPDLRTIILARHLARHTLQIIKENLAWAFGYNILAIPLAALGVLNPMVASAGMALSSVLVVSNSLRLRQKLPQVAQKISHG